MRKLCFWFQQIAHLGNARWTFPTTFLAKPIFLYISSCENEWMPFLIIFPHVYLSFKTCYKCILSIYKTFQRIQKVRWQITMITLLLEFGSKIQERNSPFMHRSYLVSGLINEAVSELRCNVVSHERWATACMFSIAVMVVLAMSEVVPKWNLPT